MIMIWRIFMLWATLVVGLLPFDAWGANADAEEGTAEGLLRKGFSCFQSGAFGEAEGCFARFLEDFGKNEEAARMLPKVRALLALSQVRQGAYERAEPSLQAALKGDPEKTLLEDLRFWNGYVRLRNGGKEEVSAALAEFRKFLKEYKGKGSRYEQEVKLAIGLALGKQKKFKEAANGLKEAEASEEGASVMKFRMARLGVLIEGGMLEEALKVFGSIDGRDEGVVRVAGLHLQGLRLGNAFFAEKRYREALSAFQRVWSRKRILNWQGRRLKELEKKVGSLEKVGKRGEREWGVAREQEERVREEVKRIEGMEDYQVGLRFRIAECFFGLERYREASLMFTEMLKEVSADAMAERVYYRRMICLARMERWREVVAAAERFAEKRPESELMPHVLYVQAEGCARLREFGRAAELYLRVAREFPAFFEAERCYFLAGFNWLRQNENGKAFELFEKHSEVYKKGKLREAALYWQGMALYLGHDYAKSRGSFEAYLKAYPKGRYRVEAEFRKAHTLFLQRKYSKAYKELERFVEAFGGEKEAAEAYSVLGDCYFAMGEVERGMKAYGRVGEAFPRLFDYAWFRVGAAYKKLEEYDKMLAHYGEFLERRPESPKVPEALRQMAWVYRKNGDREKAREIYWEAVRTYGANPEASSVEGILTALMKFYRGEEERKELRKELRGLADEAHAAGKGTLAARAIWMLAHMEGKEAEKYGNLMLEAGSAAKPRELSPLLLAEVGDVFLDRGKLDEAERFYRTLLNWWPRSILKGRGYAGLGMVARARGEEEEALRQFDLFERKGGRSLLLAKVLTARAEIYGGRGEDERAIEDLEGILEIREAKGKEWVRALYQIGGLYQKRGDFKKAIPYYQRIYIMYRRWDAYVAKAYWESGRAFEALHEKEKAMNTYREFLENTHLKETREYAKALDRVKELS